MSSSPAARRRPRPGHAWPRALVLLLALLLPAVPTAAEALTAAAPAVSAETAEHDVLHTPLRPPARAVHRADVPQRPAPLPDPAPAGPADRGLRLRATAPCPPYAMPLLRTVVLRC
ncbi:hypothetical protein ACIPSJ_16390 [Streptomyces sp. NPDC090088]|uniref:hypothetical protein n=1 Tax=Streptomyces sp. NPDC090088 TaxID=3365944 RepID=UPI003830C65F